MQYGGPSKRRRLPATTGAQQPTFCDGEFSPACAASCGQLFDGLFLFSSFPRNVPYRWLEVNGARTCPVHGGT